MFFCSTAGFNTVCVFDVIRDRRVYKEGRLSYADFVWFLISEEDKKTDTRYLDAWAAFKMCPIYHQARCVHWSNILLECQNLRAGK